MKTAAKKQYNESTEPYYAVGWRGGGNAVGTVEADHVAGQSAVLVAIRLVQDQVDQVKARQQRGRQLDIVHNGDLRVPLGVCVE